MKFLSGRVYKDSYGELRLLNSRVKVCDVLQALRHGLKPKEFTVKFPKLTDSDIHTCKAMAVMAMPDCPEYKLNQLNSAHPTGDQRSPIKILFDENLSWKIIPELIDGKHEISHIVLEDMSGSRDIDIWTKFQNNGSRAVIITRDHDFIALSEIFAMKAMLQQGNTQAIEIGNSPFVVHVNIKENKKRDVIDAFRRSSQSFMKEAARPQRRMPYMRLNRQGVFAGPSLPEVFSHFTKQNHECGTSSNVVNPRSVNFTKIYKLCRRHEVDSIDFSKPYVLAA